MSRPFLFGFSPSIDDSPLNDSTLAYKQVGDNTGNLAFCYAIDRMLGSGLPSALWHVQPSHLKTLGDIGILTLSNQLGPHANLGYLNENFKKLEINLVGMGLGAQAGNTQANVEIPQGTLDWVRIIQDKSISSKPNISVRGDFTYRVLEKYGLADKAVVLGCPTLFINPDKHLGKTITDRFSPKMELIAIAAGHQRWAHLARLEASLVKIVENSSGSYICQSPLEMVRLGRGEAGNMAQEAIEECRRYCAPWMTDAEFTEWSRCNAYSFFSAPAWMEYLRRFDFVVGTRIHGVMLALQVGVPALCLAHDSRTVELCETMALPYVVAQKYAAGITKDDLPNLFRFDYEKFDNNRRFLAKKYIGFLQDNELTCSQYLIDLSN